MRAFVLFLGFGMWFASDSFGDGFTVRVESGAASPAAIISTAAPDGFPVTGVLASGDLKVPFQRTPAGEVVFVLKDLPAHQPLSFKIESRQTEESARAVNEGDRVRLTIMGKPLLVYQGAETELPRPEIKAIYKRGGYIHPLYSPSGKVLTDDYPPNHLHHHGIWFPWTKTEFEGRHPDFWNMGEGKGKVEFVKLSQTWSGPVTAGFTTQHRFIDLTSGEPKPALNETWSVSAYQIPGVPYFVFDLVSTQRCASDSPLLLPQYYYGGLGFRGNWGWNGADNCHFLTANGENDRVKGNETRATWCHIGGDVDGVFTGLAILCDPRNFRAPQPMRLHPKEPFFCYAPSQMGDWAIKPGDDYISRYRFIVQDGEPQKDQIDRLWEAYAHPPAVTITRE